MKPPTQSPFSSRWHAWSRTAAMLACSAVLAACTQMAVAPAMQDATSPQAGAQQPHGFYRQNVGQRPVTALFDGYAYLPRGQVLGLDADRLDGLIRSAGVHETEDGLETAVNAYLVEQGDELILVDTGTAQCFGSGLGQIPRHLRAAGYRPEQVTQVLLTHGHPDHICGLIDTAGSDSPPQGAAMAYPNATVWIDATELAHWQGEEIKRRLPAAFHPLVDQARAAIAPYQAAGRLRSFMPGERLPGGVVALATPGHTPGHTSFLFDQEGPQPLLVWGDVLHFHAVQFAEPVAAYEADEDKARARQSRRDMLEQAQAHGWLVAGAHLPFPGLGQVRKQGDSYEWLPVR